MQHTQKEHGEPKPHGTCINAAGVGSLQGHTAVPPGRAAPCFQAGQILGEALPVGQALLLLSLLEITMTIEHTPG